MNQLSFKPLVMPGESLMGLAQRIVHYNSHQSFQTLINRKGHYYDYRANMNYFKSDNLWNSKVIEVLENNGYVELEKLMLNQFDDLLFGRESNLINQRQHYFQTRIKYCPDCMKDAEYHRLLWDVSMIGVCLKHKLNLIDKCPHCNRVIRINHLIGGSCVCGVRYKDVSSSPPSDASLNAQTAIQGMLTGEKSSFQLEGGATLSSREYFQVVDLFSRLLDGAPSDRLAFGEMLPPNQTVNYTLKKGSQRSFAMCVFLATAAHHLLANPSRYFASAIEVIELTRSAERVFYSKRLLIDQIIVNEKLVAHKNVYVDVHSNAVQGFARMKYVFDQDDSKYCSLSQARKILNCDDKYLSRLGENGTLVFTTRTYGRTKKITLFERSRVEAYAEFRRELLNTSQVAMWLGVTAHVVRQLADGNMLKLEHGNGKDNFVRRKIHPSTVSSLLSKINDRCEVLGSANSFSEWVQLDYESLKKLKFHMNFTSVIKAVINGEIRCCCQKEIQTLTDVYLFNNDLLAVLGK